MNKNVTDEEKKKRFLNKHPALIDLEAGEELVKDLDTGEI
ncbi:unnamed protein product [marine sediment metagenome]|uniref:Uncharacterized protein n=1 Tax=marine sediment metagenome TaxID=412755 RepID=X1IWJ7_9ZZZZ